MRVRFLAVSAATLLVAVACGNSKTDTGSGSATTASSGGTTVVTGADLQKNVPVDAPGVSDSEIGVATVTASTNILGGHYAEFADGIQAYFDYRNSQGGLYGRTFKIVKRRDDNMFQNQQTVKASLSQDKAFATFIATPLLTGVPDLAASKQLTFIWNINPEMAGHPNIFGTVGALCFACIGQGLPSLAQAMGFTKVAVLAYGSTASSQGCGQAIADSFEKYPTAKVVFVDVNLQFAQADLSSQVSQMKRGGAQFVMVCIDQKESLVLAKEIAKQDANIAINLPNGYDPLFIAENADVLEGSFVEPQFLPFEKDPNAPELVALKEWVGKSGKVLRELTIEGWIAASMFVTGLELAGPEFSQQKVVDALNRVTDFTADGLKVPIDWTKQHDDPKEHPESGSDYDCSTVLRVEGGKLVPILDQPGKPWVCVGDRTEPTLREPEYRSFAPGA